MRCGSGAGSRAKCRRGGGGGRGREGIVRGEMGGGWEGTDGERGGCDRREVGGGGEEEEERGGEGSTKR